MGLLDTLGQFQAGAGKFLFPDVGAGIPGLTPEQAEQMQRAAVRQFALTNLGNTMGGGGRKAWQGLGQSYAGANSTVNEAMERGYRSSVIKQQQERQDKQADREAKAQERAEREGNASTAGRLSQGITGAQDKMAYWRMVQGMPEVQEALGAYGIDAATITTPEQLEQISQQLGTAGQVGGPAVQAQPLQLKAVKDPKTGKPILVPEQMAVGAEPWEKPNGRGISMTTPDGTVVEIGGDGSLVGPGQLSKPSINKLQETIINSTDRLDRLNSTLATYNPDFLRAKGIATAATTKFKDFLGMKVSPEQRGFLDQYSQFQSSAATDLSSTLREMSGTAVTPQEYARTEKTLPSGTELSPTEFEAKSKVAVRTIQRAIMRANWALKNGIGVKSVEDLAKAMPLEGIDSVFEQRANQIWQEMGGSPDTKAQAMQRAKQEFGLAR